MPVTFVHLTDLHLQSGDNPTNRGLDSSLARLSAALRQAETLSPRPSFIAITGDLTDSGDEASYRILADLLSETDLPSMLVLGNHDARAPFRAVFDPAAEQPDAPYCHDRLIDGLHVIALDTAVPGMSGGALSKAALAFLDEALMRHRQSPKIVMMHHPPRHREAAGSGWDSLNADSTRALAERFQRHRIAMLLCGHVHRDHTALWHGALMVGNAGLANAIDPLDPDTLVITEGASWSFCTLRDSGPSATFVPLAPERAEIARVAAQRLTGT